MANSGIVAIAAVGLLGVGAALAYFIPPLFKPKITISPNPATPGTSLTFRYSGFPHNIALMSMGGGNNGIGSAPYNIGQTDQNGNLTIVGEAPNLPHGTIILYGVFAAQNPNIYAWAIYNST